LSTNFPQKESGFQLSGCVKFVHQPACGIARICLRICGRGLNRVVRLADRHDGLLRIHIEIAGDVGLERF
jgi:hypothetical protein